MALWPVEMRHRDARPRRQGERSRAERDHSTLPAATLRIVQPQPKRRSEVRLAVPMPPLFGTIVSLT